MTVVADRTLAPLPARVAAPSHGFTRIALLGLGRVGRAVADLLARDPACAGQPARITGALVRNTAARAHGTPCRVVARAADILEDELPDVVIEVLGGLEPARTLVLDALERGIPVITANKTLLAEHGDELVDAARRSGAALRGEASVLAGVPFLGTFARRPLASSIDGVTGILNGTSNYILSRMADGVDLSGALGEAQHLGLAEPDASRDLDGVDAADKLAILIRQFAGLRVRPWEIRSTPLGAITVRDLEHARDLGGTLKAVASARWSRGRVDCFSGPAFLHQGDPLASVGGVLNGIRLERARQAPLCFTGPGAGPEITARTILDDLAEVLASSDTVALLPAVAASSVGPPTASSWFVRLSSTALPDPADLSDFLGAHGIWVRRWGTRDTRGGSVEQRLLTFACSAEAIDAALDAVAAASACTASAFPVVEALGE